MTEFIMGMTRKSRQAVFSMEWRGLYERVQEEMEIALILRCWIDIYGAVKTTMLHKHH